MNEKQNDVDQLVEKTTRFSKRKIVTIIVAALFLCILIVFSANHFITAVVGESMEPTYKNGELLFVDRHFEIERFDVVVIDTGNKPIIKRVIGLPGETVYLSDSGIFINGEQLEDNYGVGTTTKLSADMATIVELGEDEYYVLGDNRSNSLDSRYYGAFNRVDIFGKVRR